MTEPTPTELRAVFGPPPYPHSRLRRRTSRQTLSEVAKVTSPHARNGTAVSADTCRTGLRPDRWFGLSLKPCVLELGYSYLAGSRAARSASAAAKRSQSCRCGAASRASEGRGLSRWGTVRLGSREGEVGQDRRS